MKNDINKKWESCAPGRFNHAGLVKKCKSYL